MPPIPLPFWKGACKQPELSPSGLLTQHAYTAVVSWPLQLAAAAGVVVHALRRPTYVQALLLA